MISVTTVYEDGRIENVRGDYIDLFDACNFGFELAEALGRRREGYERPRWVRIMRDSKIEISISVVRGDIPPASR